MLGSASPARVKDLSRKDWRNGWSPVQDAATSQVVASPWRASGRETNPSLSGSETRRDCRETSAPMKAEPQRGTLRT